MKAHFIIIRPECQVQDVTIIFGEKTISVLCHIMYTK